MTSRYLLAAALFACVACASTESTPAADASADAPPDSRSSVDASGDGPADAAPPVDAPSFNYNDCTNFDFDKNDFTAPDAGRTIVFSFQASPQQYAPRCMKIKASQSVRYTGSFADHPLTSAGGDVPNPFDAVPDAGQSADIVFPNPGWYGFECKVHESPAEYGAILVVP